MRKVICVFNSMEEAEAARKKLLSECPGGDCRIGGKEEKQSDFPVYAIPTNFGVNIAPQTSALSGMWQIKPTAAENNDTAQGEYQLIYIALDDKARKAETLLINLGGSHVKSSRFPKD